MLWTIRVFLRHHHRRVTQCSRLSWLRPPARVLSNQVPNAAKHDGGRATKKVSKATEIDSMGSWNSRINFSLSEEPSIRRGTPLPKLTLASVGRCSNVGRRSYQEDRFTVCEPCPNLLLLAVWDGHGGDECSTFCSIHLERFWRHRLELEERDLAEDEQADLAEVLSATLLDLDQAFSHQWTSRNEDKISPGTTATVALIRDGYELIIGHIGDSVAILCRGKEPRRLTLDHEPTDPEEKLRIEAYGGQILIDNQNTARVNGRLNMTRSIGDLDLKPYGVTAQADLERRSLKHGKDKFLVLLTDGISSVLTDQEIVNCVGGCADPSLAASRLVDQALLYSCEDNATALILPLGSWGKDEDDHDAINFSLGRNMAFTSRYN